jgi:DNA helicase HerA-like ATPase
MSDHIVIGGGGEDYSLAQVLLLSHVNRHGLIAGATGTGKTVTLQILAEGLSAAGVPVFLADIKGDVSGIAAAGSELTKSHEGFTKRAAQIGVELIYKSYPATFWDLFGEQGHPIRATVAEMGPLLLSRLMNLTDVQEGVLNVAFRVADEQGLLLLDLEDLQSLLQWCGQNAKDLSLRYGNVTTASVGAIQRSLLVLENQGGKQLFGEPALDLADLMRLDADGRGIINVLAADRLMNAPRLYATFLLWLLSELFEVLPEVGNPDKPKLVFFFDEAHLLFKDAPKALVEKVEQVARLIRSKGVGVYFITQNPADVPDSILGQLGNRIQHALRAFTAKDRKELEKAAQTYRDNPRFNTADAISQVGTGEAVTSMLDAKGIPLMVERTLIRPPSSQMGPLDANLRAGIIAASPMGLKYGTRLNRESAQEMLTRRAQEIAAEAGETGVATDAPEAEREFQNARRYDGGRTTPSPRPAPNPSPRSSTKRDDSFAGAITDVVVKELKGTTGKRIVRGILGGLFRGK